MDFPYIKDERREKERKKKKLCDGEEQGEPPKGRQWLSLEELREKTRQVKLRFLKGNARLLCGGLRVKKGRL